MFYAIELLRTVEVMHACGVAHGQLTPARVLLRNDVDEEQALARTWNPEGHSGWAQRGIAVAGWSQAIDMVNMAGIQCRTAEGAVLSPIEVGFRWRKSRTAGKA